jgi:hypothetical protein
MKFFRKLLVHKKLFILLALGMLLRSSIAVGYMLDTDPADGSLFSIVICEGPAGINAIAGLEDDQDSHHNHHAEHHGTDDKHEHVAQDHPFSACSFWSGSNLSLLADISFYQTSDYFLSDEIIIYESHLKRRLTNHSGFARAPPTLI